MKDLVQQHLTAPSQADTQKSDAAEARLCKLETGLQKLQAQNTKFEGWFQTLVRRLRNRIIRLRPSSSPFRPRQTTLPSFLSRQADHHSCLGACGSVECAGLGRQPAHLGAVEGHQRAAEPALRRALERQPAEQH